MSRKQPAITVAADEDDEFAFEPPPKRRSEVLDHPDEDFDASFESPQRAIKRRRSARQGSPIRSDDRIASLSDIHRSVVDGFVLECQGFLQQIVVKRKLRAAPFTDLMLRDMAIEFPKDKDEFCSIPGIDEDKYELYGKQFLPRIKAARESYEEMMKHAQDKVFVDPNHQTVVDLVSDEEDLDDSTFEDENFEEALADEDFDDLSVETSQYFTPPARAVRAAPVPTKSSSRQRRADAGDTTPRKQGRKAKAPPGNRGKKSRFKGGAYTRRSGNGGQKGGRKSASSGGRRGAGGGIQAMPM